VHVKPVRTISASAIEQLKTSASAAAFGAAAAAVRQMRLLLGMLNASPFSNLMTYAAAAAAAVGFQQMRLLLGMLNASPWRYYPLTLHFLTAEHSNLPRGE
jgi:hypothetical protein